MTTRQKLAMFFSISVGAILSVCLLRFFCKEIVILFAAMREDMRVSALVVAIFSSVVAMAALFIAWNNFHRGNTAVVKLVDIKFMGQVSNGTGGKLVHELNVWIKNIGIPLHRAGVGLLGRTKLGAVSVPFKRFDLNGSDVVGGTLEKGMLAQFSLGSV